MLNILTSDQFFDDRYWDTVEHSNAAYIKRMAQYLENYTPAPSTKQTQIEDGEIR